MVQLPREMEAETTSVDESGEEEMDSCCPLCGIATEDATRTYTHLQIGHKKSELAGLVVDW